MNDGESHCHIGSYGKKGGFQEIGSPDKQAIVGRAREAEEAKRTRQYAEQEKHPKPRRLSATKSLFVVFFALFQRSILTLVR